MSEPAKVLLLDIETSPILAYVWKLWEADAIAVKQNWYVLGFAYKWFGERKTHTRMLPDYPGYEPNSDNDRALCIELRVLLDQADVVIWQNGDRFDGRKMNARFIYHGLNPPSLYKTIDTLKIARKHFAFDSNRLDALGEFLDEGHKIAHTGYKNLWLRCMAGDPIAWRKMRHYNKRDVDLLEKIYLRLRPWATTPSQHPNLTWWTREDACPTCRSHKIESKGWRYTSTGQRRRYVCNDCGHRFDAGPLERKPAIYRAPVTGGKTTHKDWERAFAGKPKRAA